MTCLFSAQYSQSADVYTYSESTNKRTGQKIKSWSLSATIACQAAPLTPNSISKTTGIDEEFNNIYQPYNSIKVRSSSRVKLSSKITNIKNTDGEVLWVEDDEIPTVFEVVGVNPSLDILGTVLYYEIFCRRASSQEI